MPNSLEDVNESAYGMVVPPSTTTDVTVLTYRDKNKTPIVGQTVYADQQLNDGYVYRSVGTVTDVTTHNNMIERNPSLMSTISKDSTNTGSLAIQADQKHFSMKVQATYRRAEHDNGTWEQVGTGLLSSPETSTHVHIMQPHVIREILGNVIDKCTYVGTYRGMKGVKMPMMIPGFNTRRGATHQAVVGRSGSGKTAIATEMFSAQMSNEKHAIIVIDPQGQWSSESGFLWSLQGFARKIGREVTVLRVGEDIRLPLTSGLLASIMNELRLWSNLQRMGAENAEALSDEVSKLVARFIRSNPEVSVADMPRESITYAFRTIAESDDILARIYSRTGEAGASLKVVLGSMSGADIEDKEGMSMVFAHETLENAQDTLNHVLEKFTPLLNLFLKENLNGGPRKSLGGRNGFLTNVLRAREDGETAPYVVLDMSSDVSLHAANNYAQSASNAMNRLGLNDDDHDELLDPTSVMRTILDNSDIKARIVSTVLDNVVRQAETAFAQGGHNLDTQIIFDEAWRYAPNPGAVPRQSSIHELTTRLAGYALDTRKYGVGWTYILQSPSDLNPTIWRQLTYVWSGYGMMSGDKRMIEELIDDRLQLRLYDQFADPNATGVYPFMVTGPVNPLIFTSSPSFVNAFNTPAEFLEANKEWIDAICDRNGLTRFTHSPDSIEVNRRGSVTARVSTTPRARVAGIAQGVGEAGVPTQTTVTVPPPPF